MNVAEKTSSNGRRGQSGPPLLAPGIAVAALTVVGLVLGATGPRPTTPPAELMTYLQTNSTSATVLAAAMFGTSIPLSIWSAVAYRRLRQLGVTAPGTAIGFGGGLIASAMLALSGLVSWAVATSADVATPETLRVLTTLSFAAGGPGFVGGFALLVAGVAVPSLILRLLPRGLAWAGLIVAALGMLSVFSLLTPALYVLLPIGRFAGLLWLLTTSALLPRTRPRRTTSTANHTAPSNPAQTKTEL